jgi:hypothetical protein
MHNDPMNLKRNSNIMQWICMIHQRGIIVPMRENFGKEALMPCAFSLVVMCLWAAFTKDAFMWFWIALWLVALVKRRTESAKMVASGVRVHSYYDGWPKEAVKIGKTEKTAKLVVEPAFVVLLGTVLYYAYQEFGLPVAGLPSFFLCGIITLPFVEMVKQRIWEKRMDALSDARLEQEAMVRESRERYGE